MEYTISGLAIDETIPGLSTRNMQITFKYKASVLTLPANTVLGSQLQLTLAQATNTLTVSLNGGTWSGTTPQELIEGGTTTINDPTKTNYRFNGWTVLGGGSSLVGTTFTMGYEDTSVTAKWIYEPELLVGNYPTLLSGMIPVTFDTSTRLWIKADLSSAWYDYSSGVGMWANMVQVSSTNRNTYVNAAAGTSIPFADIIGMYVWIPRYSYAKMGTWGNGGTSSTSPGSMTIKFVNTSTDETGDAAYTSGNPTSSDWRTHPSFWMDLDNDNIRDSGEQKKGFWFAKFEAGSSTACTAGTTVGAGCDITTLYPIIKPNVTTWRGVLVSTAYVDITNYMTGSNGNTYYGLPNDSSFEVNVPTNSDWGAVTYLTQSIYGKYGNTNFATIALKEVYNNNASTPTSGRSGGRPGYASGYTVAAGCFDYDGYIRTNNVACNPAGNFSGTVGQILSGANLYLAYGASTTGTVYGIYDMAGGVNEWVMTDYYSTTTSPYNYSGYSSTANTGFNGMFGQSGGPLTTGRAWPQFRYYDRHTSTTFATACGGICYGQAHSEVYSTTGWYSDTNGSGLTTSYVTFARGGIYNSAAASGIFHATRSYGTQTTTIGFRPVIKPLN
jgi:uncharacterized repeat protein (TIGR02543 family)